MAVLSTSHDQTFKDGRETVSVPLGKCKILSDILRHHCICQKVIKNCSCRLFNTDNCPWKNIPVNRCSKCWMPQPLSCTHLSLLLFSKACDAYWNSLHALKDCPHGNSLRRQTQTPGKIHHLFPKDNSSQLNLTLRILFHWPPRDVQHKYQQGFYFPFVFLEAVQY